MVKVLILHQHFNTPAKGGAIRSYYLAKALVDHGISTVVITAHNEKEYVRRDVEGIDVHYLPIPYENKFGFTARSISFLRFVWKSVRLVGKLDSIKVCYAISVPLTIGLAAKRIRKKYKIPYIFEVGDLWPDAPIQMGFVKNYFFQRMLYALEKSIYEKAESIVALSDPIRTAISLKVPGKKVILIPNMADCEYFTPEKKEIGNEQAQGVQGKFVISYIGAVGVANGLEFLLDCAKTTQHAGLPVHFFICGEGALRDELKALALRLNLVNLTFLDFATRAGVRELLNITDAVMICYKQVPVLETGSPNKFFDGLAAGKLILINFGGWIRNEIEEHHCGVYLDPREPASFVTTIAPFLSNPALLQQYQSASRQLGASQYSRTKLSKEFARLFSGAARL